jgi:uroporphyrinogen-III synthase
LSTRVLVLRPEPGASETVRKARERGLDAVAVPLFEIEPIGWKAPDPGHFDGLLLTSANAVRHAGAGLQALRSLPVYAVGGATADMAREAGFTIVQTGAGGVDQLLGSANPDLRLLHLCGEDRKKVEAPRAITPLTVYRSKAIETPDLPLSGCVTLIHSPRAGRRFAELVSDRASIAIAAISPAAADAVGAGWRSVEAAEQPNDEALLALAARLCNNPQPK